MALSKSLGTTWEDYRDAAKELFSGAEPSVKGIAVGYRLDVILNARVGGHQKGKGQQGKSKAASDHGKNQANDWLIWLKEVQRVFLAKYPNRDVKAAKMYEFLELSSLYT